MSDMESPFAYTPLDQPTEQIRLLTIHPGLPESPLHCTITVVSLKRKPPYVAISYTWGPPTPTATITIDQKPMTVRQGCHDALRTMRSHHSNVPVWIDAICINQGDMHEKSSQVGMMGTIYHGAKSVAACLECGDSLATMRNLYPLIPRTVDASQAQDEVFERWQAAVHAILANPYFTRMWIVQEIGLARELRLYSGEDVLDWSELERQAYDWRGKMKSLKRYPPGPDLERALKELSDTRTGMGTHKWYARQKQNQTVTLTGLMSQHLTRACENPRDRMYAMLPMLGHAGGFDSHHMQPAYDESEFHLLWTYVCRIRFPGQPELRKNSISTGFELWTGLKTFEKLVECFKIPAVTIRGFFEVRMADQYIMRSASIPAPSTAIETHFLGYAMRISCPDSSAYAGLVGDNAALSSLPQPSRHFLAVWPGLPTAAFTLGPRCMCISESPEEFKIDGYYPFPAEIEALQRLPERCDCSSSSCPAKRSKREIYVHPQDLLAMAFHIQRSPSDPIPCFTTGHTRSFIRMSEPREQQQKPGVVAPWAVSGMLPAGLRSALGW
ncbi:heterokaryon incompatibility protein-domain-containing protein [Chaetomium fimeti]|uniref:Heterokaryon incompatibility protein-domain-containing protein n=1 Tax=Chaetomium fimeti TaxID=1854472 RepID=A0AAE0H6I8_9PEZI|nr:heterokaryon incompatibility protein-domain-containing protein [Chaetomium fimeti]